MILHLIKISICFTLLSCSQVSNNSLKNKILIYDAEIEKKDDSNIISAVVKNESTSCIKFRSHNWANLNFKENFSSLEIIQPQIYSLNDDNRFINLNSGETKKIDCILAMDNEKLIFIDGMAYVKTRSVVSEVSVQFAIQYSICNDPNSKYITLKSKWLKTGKMTPQAIF